MFVAAFNIFSNNWSMIYFILIHKEDHIMFIRSTGVVNFFHRICYDFIHGSLYQMCEGDNDGDNNV